MPRPNVRCGSTVSPAENVTYCQPSYAHSTPIIAVIALTNVLAVGNVTNPEPWCGRPGDAAISTIARITMTPTFNAVATPCTSALSRVPRMFSAVTAAIITTAAPADPAGESGMNTVAYRGNAAASVASDPLPMTRNIVQPYTNATSGPNASRR